MGVLPIPLRKVFGIPGLGVLGKRARRELRGRFGVFMRLRVGRGICSSSRGYARGEWKAPFKEGIRSLG
jgi:hypothetical protein